MKLKILATFMVLCIMANHALGQDTLPKKGIYFQFSNGHASFPKQEIMLGNDLNITTLGTDLSWYHHFQLGFFKQIKSTPITILGGLGYTNIQHFVQFYNFRDREDMEQFNYPTFQIYTSTPIHQRLTMNLSARYYPLKWLFLQGGIAGMLNVFNYKGSDYQQMYKGFPGMWETYGDLFLWPNNVNKFGASANIGLGFEWKGIFIKYFWEKGLTDFKVNIPFRGNDYDLNFGRNDNQGVSLGYLLTLK